MVVTSWAEVITSGAPLGSDVRHVVNVVALTRQVWPVDKKCDDARTCSPDSQRLASDERNPSR